MSVQKVSKKLTALDIKAMKGVTPIVSLTAYTTPMAKALDPLVDFLLVGDSLAMTVYGEDSTCLLYTSPSPRDATLSRMPSSA